MSDALSVIISTAVGVYLFKMWMDDYRNPESSGFRIPGAFPASSFAIFMGVMGALVILAAEVWGEYQLGIVEEQTSISWFFLLAMIAAGITEEIVFRGFLVIDKRGLGILILSILFVSLVFTLLHPYLWVREDGAFLPRLQLSDKGLFSSAFIFVNSLWFYTVRFWPLNRTRSLIPCFAAHIISNVSVFAVKWAQGFVSGIF